MNALKFEARQELNLLALQRRLVARTYKPARSVCFFVQKPKLREVFAADFQDRVVHHVLVAHLNKIWEPIFMHDSFACRKGKGVHAGVQRLQTFVRQATSNQTRPAFYLQLDIRNYLMSIDKAKLFAMLEAKLRPASNANNAQALWLCRTLVFHDCTVNPVVKGDVRLVDKLPKHKTLFHAPAGKGLPIGNLNSQFFANVYLNALDQFVKHELKCRWYVRYCDDFVLVAHSAEQLAQWRTRIAVFLSEQLLLQLNPVRDRLKPVADGIDFLGYIIRPSHLLERKRVIGHLREKPKRQEAHLVRRCGSLTTFQFDYERLRYVHACLASYLGHFKPAASHRLINAIWQANAWLDTFFEFDRVAGSLRFRGSPPLAARSVLAQYRHWHEEFAGDVIFIQVGAFIERLQWPVTHLKPLGKRKCNPRGTVMGMPLWQWPHRLPNLLQTHASLVLISQVGTKVGAIEARMPSVRMVNANITCAVN